MIFLFEPLNDKCTLNMNQCILPFVVIKFVIKVFVQICTRFETFCMQNLSSYTMPTPLNNENTWFCILKPKCGKHRKIYSGIFRCRRAQKRIFENDTLILVEVIFEIKRLNSRSLHYVVPIDGCSAY